jgi:hypothetical protein
MQELIEADRRIEQEGGTAINENCDHQNSHQATFEAQCRAPPPRVAAVSWAQRTDRLYLTIEVTQCQQPALHIDPSGKLVFRGRCGLEEVMYEVELELYDQVDKTVRGGNCE